MNTQLLFDLLDAYGPSGREQQVRTIIHKEIDKYVDDVKVDKFGNLVAHKKGNGPKVLITAHMDEVGLMVKGVSEEGRIHIAKVGGGIEVMALLGQSVCILGKTNKCLVEGIISYVKLQDGMKIEKMPELKDLYVDIGVTKEEVHKVGITTGDYVIPKHKATFLANEDVVSGKAIDNRVGCFILIEMLKQLKNIPYDLYAVFTVQEEIGLYGAKIMAYAIDPDWAIAIDVSNTKNAEDAYIEPALGKGPVITCMDSAIISNTCLNEWIEQAAKKVRVNIQHEVEEDGMTDAGSIMFSKAGVPSTAFSIPIRNIHSTVSIVSLSDVQDTIAVMVELLKTKQTRCLV